MVNGTGLAFYHSADDDFWEFKGLYTLSGPSATACVVSCGEGGTVRNTASTGDVDAVSLLKDIFFFLSSRETNHFPNIFRARID